MRIFFVRKVNRVNKLITQNRFDEAHALVTEYFEKNKLEQGVLHTLRGTIFSFEDNIEGAADAYRRALDCPRTGAARTARYELARCLNELDQEEEALSVTRELCELHPNFVDGLRLKGELLVRAERYKEAGPCLRNAILVGGATPYIYWYLSMAEYMLGNDEQGRTCLHRSLEGKSKYIERVYELGEWYYDIEQYACALEVFLLHVQHFPADTSPTTYLRYLAHTLDAWPNVIRMAKEIAEGHDDAPAARLLLAEHEFSLGNISSCRVMLDDILRKNSDSADARILDAELAVHEERNQYAYEKAHELLVEGVDHGSLKHTLACAAGNTGHFEEAVEYALEELRDAPENVEFHGVLAYSRYLQKDFAAARPDFEAYLDAYPDDQNTRACYACTLHQLEKFEDATREYEKCLVVEPDDMEMLDGLMSALESLGDLDASKKIAMRLLRMNYNAPGFTDFLDEQGWRE